MHLSIFRFQTIIISSSLPSPSTVTVVGHWVDSRLPPFLHSRAGRSCLVCQYDVMFNKLNMSPPCQLLWVFYYSLVLAFSCKRDSPPLSCWVCVRLFLPEMCGMLMCLNLLTAAAKPAKGPDSGAYNPVLPTRGGLKLSFSMGTRTTLYASLLSSSTLLCFSALWHGAALKEVGCCDGSPNSSEPWY